MHVAYKNVHSTSSLDKAYFFEEQGSNILHDEHQSIIRNNDNDDMVAENSLDSMSDASMDNDVTYMDYSLIDDILEPMMMSSWNPMSFNKYSSLKLHQYQKGMMSKPCNE